jgi:hypothetical protein
VREALTRAAIGALAGMLAGAVAGIGARVAMRMVADGVADGVGVRATFTPEGTAAIIVFGIVIGAPFGVLFGAIAERLPGPEWLRAPMYGLLCLAVMGPVFFVGNEEFFSTGRVALFASLFLIYGIALGVALAPSRRIAVALPLAAQVLLALIALAGGGLAAVGIVSLALQSTGLVPM